MRLVGQIVIANIFAVLWWAMYTLLLYAWESIGEVKAIGQSTKPQVVLFCIVVIQAACFLCFVFYYFTRG